MNAQDVIDKLTNNGFQIINIGDLGDGGVILMLDPELGACIDVHPNELIVAFRKGEKIEVNELARNDLDIMIELLKTHDNDTESEAVFVS